MADRYAPRSLDGNRWAVLDQEIDDLVLDGPQDNLYAWSGSQDEAEDYAVALNA